MLEKLSSEDFQIEKLGDCTHASPLAHARFTDDDEGVATTCLRSRLISEDGAPLRPEFFEKAGPRRKLYFSPGSMTCAIVTCGGLCPGINDVIRGITLHLEKGYGVENLLGLRYGYQGLVEKYGHEPLHLTGDSVSEIHRRGGTVLKSSRGEQDPGKMVDYLVEHEVQALFVIGGDGTMRGAKTICAEIARRGLKISVIGVPKTIDNDIAVIQKTFGFETAVAEAVRAITGGHIEAHDAFNGVAVIQLMGRDAGFIAAAASIASGDVNFCLVPEVPFSLHGENGLLERLRERLHRRGHAVIVVAEGAGAELREEHGYEDIGLLVKDQIKEEFARRRIPVSVKYIDPSYIIRSVPATADDSVFCAQLAHYAVDAAMAGRTDMMVGYYNDHFVHLPLKMVTADTKRLDTHGRLWAGVLASTGQPEVLA